MPDAPKRSVCTSLAFLTIGFMVIAIIVGLSMHKGIDGPGAMADFSFLAVPAMALMIAGPIAVLLSIVALIRKEPSSPFTMLILIPSGLLLLGMLKLAI